MRMPRKTVKGQYVTARVNGPTKAQLQAIARDERRTISQVVALLLESALQARQSQKAAA